MDAESNGHRYEIAFELTEAVKAGLSVAQDKCRAEMMLDIPLQDQYYIPVLEAEFTGPQLRKLTLELESMSRRQTLRKASATIKLDTRSERCPMLLLEGTGMESLREQFRTLCDRVGVQASVLEKPKCIVMPYEDAMDGESRCLCAGYMASDGKFGEAELSSVAVLAKRPGGRVAINSIRLTN